MVWPFQRWAAPGAKRDAHAACVQTHTRRESAHATMGAAMAHRLSLLTVDDEALFSDLLARALGAHPQVSGVTACADCASALAAAQGAHFDVALLDIGLGPQPPGLPQNGLELGEALRALRPRLGVVLLSNHRDLEFVRALSRRVSGGWSYLLKQRVGDLDALMRAVVGAAEGLVVLDPVLTAPALGTALPLSGRQEELLALAAQGYSNAGIAARLSLSPRSVDNQMGQLYSVLGLSTDDPHVQPRVAAVLRYLEGGGG